MLLIGLAVAATAPTTEPAAAPLSLSAISDDIQCPAVAPEEVVVCGARKQGYRLDPAVLAAQRALEPKQGESARSHDSANDRSCVPEGPNGCPGRDVIPVLRIAMTAVRSALLAAEGEDWRQPLRTRPDEYAAYDAAKRKKKPRVSIQFGSR